MGKTYRTSDKKAWIGWKGLPSYVSEYNFVIRSMWNRQRTVADPVIGSWIIGGEAAGIGIRENRMEVTDNLSEFVPHIIG